MNIRPIEWIQQDKTWISSFIFWTHDYIPYQSVMLRMNGQHEIHMVYYFKMLDQFVGSMVTIPRGRTHQEEEWLFHIAFKGLELLEEWIRHPDQDGSGATPLPKSLATMIEEAFISELGMQLIEEEHQPDFGFYSLSPNFKKIKKMVEGKSFSLLTFLKEQNYLK